MANNPYADALQGLQRLNQGFTRTLPGSAFTPSQIDDPAAQLYALQDQRKGELIRNIMSGGAGPAGPANLQDIQEDIARSPITQQRADVDTINKANLAAMLGGFTGGAVKQAPPAPDVVGPQVPTFTSEPTLSPAQQQARAMMGMEAAKIQAPIEAERARQTGALAIEQAKEKGFESRYNQLLDMLQTGQVAPGMRVMLPGGGGVSTATPAQMTPPGLGAPTAKDIERWSQRLQDLEHPDVVRRASSALAEKYGFGQTIEQEKAGLQKLISDAQGRLGIGGKGGAADQGALRQQAVDALTKAGYPTTEANIQHIMKQLQGQQ